MSPIHPWGPSLNVPGNDRPSCAHECMSAHGSCACCLALHGSTFKFCLITSCWQSQGHCVDRATTAALRSTAPARSPTHSRAHEHTRARAHAHTHSHTHTHSLFSPLFQTMSSSSGALHVPSTPAPTAVSPTHMQRISRSPSYMEVVGLSESDDQAMVLNADQM